VLGSLVVAVALFQGSASAQGHPCPMADGVDRMQCLEDSADARAIKELLVMAAAYPNDVPVALARLARRVGPSALLAERPVNDSERSALMSSFSYVALLDASQQGVDLAPPDRARMISYCESMVDNDAVGADAAHCLAEITLGDPIPLVRAAERATRTVPFEKALANLVTIRATPSRALAARLITFIARPVDPDDWDEGDLNARGWACTLLGRMPGELSPSDTRTVQEAIEATTPLLTAASDPCFLLLAMRAPR
jgi:hypothetical protein